MFGIPSDFVAPLAALIGNIAWSAINAAWTILCYRMQRRQDKKFDAFTGNYVRRLEVVESDSSEALRRVEILEGHQAA